MCHCFADFLIAQRAGSIRLCDSTVRTVAPTALSGPGERVLLRPRDLSYDDYVGHAFDQLRFPGARDPEVAAALMRTLNMLIRAAEDADLPHRVPALISRRDQVLAAVERHDGWLPPGAGPLRARSPTSTPIRPNTGDTAETDKTRRCREHDVGRRLTKPSSTTHRCRR